MRRIGPPKKPPTIFCSSRDFGGVKFPMLLHTHQGDPRLNVAHNYYEDRVTSVTPNAPVNTMPVPEAVAITRSVAAHDECDRTVPPAQPLQDRARVGVVGTDDDLVVAAVPAP